MMGAFGNGISFIAFFKVEGSISIELYVSPPTPTLYAFMAWKFLEENASIMCYHLFLHNTLQNILQYHPTFRRCIENIVEISAFNKPRLTHLTANY
jgi:hypothetical protein